MKALIVDDEFNSRRITRKYVSEAFPEISFLNDAATVDEAVERINKENPDILFLDIQLKGSLSFDILDKITINHQQIIFITAYDQYALKAFDVGASKYILKPIEKEKLIKAVKDVYEYVFLLQNKNLKDEKTENNLNDKLIIPGTGYSTLIEINDIIYVQAEGAYCKIFTIEKTYMLVKPLNFVDEKLKNLSNFVRIHKSYLINLNYVESVNNDGNSLKLKESALLPIARSRKIELKELLSKRFY